jgi:predicted glycosyl hydrolase (DUF1957 family)
LDVAEHEGIPIGVELTGWTLKTIEAIEPAWVERFRRLLHDGKCELIGSGYTQLIGPLVPYAVNRHNQRLGMDVYQRLLGCRPKLALVNEMAFSAGIVPAYKEAGYQAIIFEKENALLAKREEQGQNPENLQALRKQLPLVVEGGGARLPVLWALRA